MSVNEEFLGKVLEEYRLRSNVAYSELNIGSYKLQEYKKAQERIDKTYIKAIFQHSQQEQERVVKQARADQLKKLWNATQHDIVPEGTPPRDMSEELHKMIKELEE
ncbi:MAG: hypothetical protein KBC44_03350 [Candidatus Pacebacteria bacterium]|nr:hypothetical protein [Candidatus Paceibacterota bacterium]